MKEQIYLSIDLDYWTCLKTFSIEECNEFIKRIKDVESDKFIFVFSHEDLLTDINESDCNSLVNVDFHSDLANYDDNLLLNEGTWVNFVSWKNEGKFSWRFPSNNLKSLGCCHDSSVNDFSELNCKNTGWKKIESIKGTKNISWSKVRRVGISLSPDWIQTPRVLQCVLPSLLHKNITYKDISFDYAPDYNIKSMLKIQEINSNNFPINIDRSKFARCFSENLQAYNRAKRNGRNRKTG